MDNETKANMNKQTQLLENLNHSLMDKQKQSDAYKELDDKLTEYKKESKLKLKLLKQKQKIDSLSQNQLLYMARVNSQADLMHMNPLNQLHPGLVYPQRDFYDFLKTFKQNQCPLHSEYIS